MNDAELLNRRLLLFTGKGGVGKSTVVAALALELAYRGRRPLIVEMGHRASMESLFAVDTIGYQPRLVGRGVHAMNLDFDSTLADYMTEHVRVAGVAKAILRNDTLGRFFQSAPAIAEIAALNKISALERETQDGRPRWDPILVDLDATGHALMLLNLPRVMDGLVGDGPMRRLVDGFSSLLTDPKRTTLNLVTLPAELPVQETCELYSKLRGEHRVALGLLFVNQVPRPPIDPTLHETMRDLAQHLVTEVVTQDAASQTASAASQPALVALQEDLRLAERAMANHQLALEQIARLRREVNLPIVELGVVASREVQLDTAAAIGRTIVETFARTSVFSADDANRSATGAAGSQGARSPEAGSQ